MEFDNKMGLEKEEETMTKMAEEDGVADESLKMGDIELVADVELQHHEEVFNTAQHDHIPADYSTYTKQDIVELLKTLLVDDNFKKIDAILSEVKTYYNAIRNTAKATALEVFTSEGGTAEDFDYKSDELDHSFDATIRLLKDRKFNFYKKIENNKNENLKTKEGLLEKLRSLADEEDTEHSFHSFKEIQIQWKQIGSVPTANVKSLWANYSALVDRFYDNRSIYFELKELDRKRNLEAKIELCKRAEHLLLVEKLKDAVHELNELHEDFRHIGPVPREDKDVTWQRFKAASDAIYKKRDAFINTLQQELTVNLAFKAKIIEEVLALANFQSDRIKEWNQKTQEVLELQKKWEASGAVPRNKAKEINRKFWSAFKTFFANKNVFFKKLDEERDKNLNLKKDIVSKANELKESLEWDKTANQLKDLQNKWKDIGPVPEKYREKIFQEFKSACDHFFEQRRVQFDKHDHEQEDNLSKKLLICEELEKATLEKSGTTQSILNLQRKFDEAGFVPKKAINSIRDRFSHAIESAISSLQDVSSEEKEKLMLELELGSLKNDPDAERKIYQKEQAIRKRMTKVENDIALWKNNIEFFGRSKNADKVKDEFNGKIKEASDHLKELKDQLKLLKSI